MAKTRVNQIHLRAWKHGQAQPLCAAGGNATTSPNRDRVTCTKCKGLAGAAEPEAA